MLKYFIWTCSSSNANPTQSLCLEKIYSNKQLKLTRCLLTFICNIKPGERNIFKHKHWSLLARYFTQMIDYRERESGFRCPYDPHCHVLFFSRLKMNPKNVCSLFLNASNIFKKKISIQIWDHDSICVWSPGPQYLVSLGWIMIIMRKWSPQPDHNPPLSSLSRGLSPITPIINVKKDIF